MILKNIQNLGIATLTTLLFGGVTISASAVTIKTFSTTGDLDPGDGKWIAEFSYDIDDFLLPPSDFTSGLTSFNVDFFDSAMNLSSSITSDAGDFSGSFVGNQAGAGIIQFSTDNVLNSVGESSNMSLTMTLDWDEFQTAELGNTMGQDGTFQGTGLGLLPGGATFASGCTFIVPVPEYTSNLSLLAISIGGGAFTLKRKLKKLKGKESS